MTLQMRSFHWEFDFSSVQDFIREIFVLTPSGRYWNPNRFENRKFGPCGTEYSNKEDEHVKIWELQSNDGNSEKIIAISIEDEEPYYWILTHPNYKQYEIDIIKWLENKYRISKKNGISSGFFLNVLEDDFERIKILQNLGYKNLGRESYNRIRTNDKPIQQYQLPPGFLVRNVEIIDDFDQYREVLGSVFGHCKNMTLKKVEIYSKASFYRSELDIVAVDEYDIFAAFCTIRFDSKSRVAELEPVGTHPKYRKMGLGKAVILEGLKRLEKYHPKCVFLNNAADTEGANALYDSLGFVEKQECLLWKKEL